MDNTYLRRLARNIGVLYAEIGAALATPTTVLRCATCGYEEHLTPTRAAEDTMHGWPTHCGRTMRQEQKEKPDAGYMAADLGLCRRPPRWHVARRTTAQGAA